MGIMLPAGLLGSANSASSAACRGSAAEWMSRRRRRHLFTGALVSLSAPLGGSLFFARIGSSTTACRAANIDGGRLISALAAAIQHLYCGPHNAATADLEARFVAPFGRRGEIEAKRDEMRRDETRRDAMRQVQAGTRRIPSRVAL